MNTITVQMQIPEQMQPYLAKDNTKNALRQYAMLLYPYIYNQTISCGRAAEILEIHKLDLIDIYAEMGFPYFDMTMNELEEDMVTLRSLKETIQ